MIVVKGVMIMSLGSIIGASILCIIAIMCFLFSYLQFHEKGFLFNNAYIYANKKERETMDKKPHYRQSGIVFLLIGTIFLINTVEVLVETGWLFYLVIVVGVIAIIYATISSVQIERSKEKVEEENNEKNTNCN